MPDKGLKACMHGDPLRSYLSLMSIKNQHNEDILKSVRCRERSMAVSNMINMPGFEHVKDDSSIETIYMQTELGAGSK